VEEETVPSIDPLAFAVLAKSGPPLTLDVAAVPALWLWFVLVSASEESAASMRRALFGVTKSLDAALPGVCVVIEVATES
jgi:hypothetical protein